MARFRVALLVLTSLTACTSAVYRVEENVPHGTVVYRASGEDGSNYQFQKEDGFFSISESGEIRTNGTLDREAVVDKYGTDTVTYTISYLVESRKSSFDVSIQVDDVNDNAPQFDNLPPSINVGSNAQGPIWPLSATDPDRGANSTVDFEIVSGNGEGFFEITHLVGDVSRKRLSLTMSPPTGRTFTLVLKVEDEGTPTRLSNSTSLQVNISSIANDAPVFAQSSYNFLVPLSARVGRSIGIVSAVDPDSNLNASIIYYFDESDTSYLQATRYFSINASTGILKLRSSPDQQVTRVSFLVYARNTLTVTGVELTSSVPVFVRFYRGNDIPQIILLDNSNPVPASIHVPENLPYFTLENMLVVDEDTVVNTSVLVSPNISHVFNTLVLHFGGTETLNILTFNITGPIDREEVPVINITLMATDSEDATGSVTIQVKIDDENDNDPRFDNGGEYHFRVEETLEVGTVVGRVNATDPDFGSNGTVEYAVTNVSPSQAEGLFSLRSSTGEVVAVRPLNYEDENLQHITISIEAYDLGLDRRVSNASIIIDVLNVNEPPTFAPDVLTEIDIRFDMKAPRTLSTFLATDDDDDDRLGRVTYDLSCSEDVNSFLEINQDAELRVITLPQVVPSPINCTIRSSDSSGHSSSLDVTLFYIDDQCSSGPCENSATCSNTRSGFLCKCPPLFGGERCDLPRDPCDFYSCENNATCTGTALSHNYSCYCMRGYSGKRCEIKPISFTGKGYAVYSSLDGDDDLTSFSLEVSTHDSYGLLFYKPFENNAFVSLEIVQDKVVLKDTRVSPSIEIVNSTVLRRSGSWYMVAVVYRSGQPSLSVEIATSSKVTMDASRGPLDGRSYQVFGGISDISKTQLSKLSAFDFFGCIGYVVLNNKLLDLSRASTSSRNFKIGCDPATPSLLSSSHCVACDDVSNSACSYVKSRLSGTCTKDTLLMSFNGHGFVQLDFEDAFFFYAWVLQQGQDRGRVARETVRNSNYEISLSFAASKPSGILFAISNNQSYHVLVITDTNLTYFIHHSSGVQSKVTLEGNYHDNNKWHRVTIHVSSNPIVNVLTISTDRDSKTVSLLSDVGVSLNSRGTKFYVGGVSSVLSHQIRTTISSLTVDSVEGCISNLTVNNILIPLGSSIDGVVMTTSLIDPFNEDTSTCPNNEAPTSDDLNIYLVIAMPAAGIILLLILVSIIVGVIFCCRNHCPGRKATFRVDSQNSIGGQSSMMHYHDEAGEFHPDEKEEKEENYHLRQTSIDSPAVNGMRQHLGSSTSQETGFHEPPLLHGGSSTDIKSEFSDADESTQPHSDDDNRTRNVRANDHLKRQRMKMRRTDPRQRCDSLTSTEEQIIKPLQMRESDIRTPSLENVLDIKNSVFISHPRPKVPSPITPLHFQEVPLQSLSVPRVTPNHYWEEANRMKPAVDTEDHNLRLSQLKNEPFWVMDPPSSSTSVVSSAVDDHLIGRYRQGEFILQGGVEEEGGIDNLSHHTEDSLNQYGRVHRHRHPFDGSQQRPLWSLLRKPPYFHPAQVPGHPPPQRPLTSNIRPFSPPKYPGVFPSAQPQSPRRVPESPNEFSGLHSSHSSGGIPKAYSIRETPSGHTSRGMYSPHGESPNLHPESGENPRGTPNKGSGYQHHSQDYPSPEMYNNENTKVVSPKITLADLATRSRKGEQVDLNQYLSRDPHPSFSQPVSGVPEDHQFDRLLPYVVKHPSLDGRRVNYCKTSSDTRQPPVEV